MTVRREIAQSPCETGARGSGDWLRRLGRCLSRSQNGDSRQKEGRQSPTICWRTERRARLPGRRATALAKLSALWMIVARRKKTVLSS